MAIEGQRGRRLHTGVGMKQYIKEERRLDVKHGGKKAQNTTNTLLCGPLVRVYYLHGQTEHAEVSMKMHSLPWGSQNQTLKQ